MAKKMTNYLIYRHGSNGANQSMCNKMPVAIVTAESKQAAKDAVALERPEITVYANQFLSAIPESTAPVGDWNAQLEYDMQRLSWAADEEKYGASADV